MAKKSKFKTLTELELKVLSYVVSELESWRVSEPSYSCIGGTDVSKYFKWNNKNVTSGIISSLVKKRILYVFEDYKDIVYVDWDMIPLDFIKNSISDDANHLQVSVLESTKTQPKIQRENKSISKNTDELNKKHRPYQLYGNHGKNSNLEGFEQGDKIQFILKGESVTGEYRHLHINKHSPSGYVVIRYNDAIFERAIGKVSKPNVDVK